ncbi:MAG: alpha/beta fold hydrolase [Candidatus Acidiferrales bacterium]
MPKNTWIRHQILGVASVAVLVSVIFLIWYKASTPPEVIAAKLPEQVVFAHTSDDIIDAGVMFTPASDHAKPVAIIWIHGWGVNFYQPTYVGIGRELAALGYTVIIGNTRMHDLGNVEAWRGATRIRGGGYWGMSRDEVRDLAAWIDFAESRGFKKVILVGHSAGWAGVRGYQSEKQDPRVIGMVLASGEVHSGLGPMDPDQLAEAKRLMAEGEADALIRDPKRSYPSYISAATFLDIANSPAALKDFFGEQTPNAGITRIHCPLLAFFGTQGDVGSQADLDKLKSTIQRQPSGPSRVTTAAIQGADHMYTGQEAQVAQVIAKWADTL